MIKNHIKKAWKAYRKNWKEYAKAILLALLLTIFLNIIFQTNITLTNLREEIKAALSAKDYAKLSSLGVLTFSLILIAIIVSIVVTSIIKMSEKSLKGKTSLKHLFETVKKKWLDIIGLRMVFIFIFAVSLGIIFLGLATANALLSLLAIPALIAFLIMAYLSEYALIIDDLHPLTAIKRSFKVTKGNVLKLIFLILFVGILGAILQLIPLIGKILDIFVILPFTMITFSSFYKSIRKR